MHDLSSNDCPSSIPIYKAGAIFIQNVVDRKWSKMPRGNGGGETVQREIRA